MKIPVKVWIIVALITVARAFYSFNISLVPDEAYYWDWTRFLSTGFFDHPPMVALIARFFALFTGGTVITVKLVPLLANLGVTVFMLLLAKEYCRKTSSFYLALAVLNGTLLFGVVLLLLTPDAPQMLFWSAGLYVGYIVFFKKSKIAWLILGVICGLGLLSKYIFILFIGSLFLFMLFDRAARKFFTTPYPYLSLLIAFLVFLPNILWNASHGYVSYLFQIEHGLGSQSWPGFKYFWEYIGGQTGLLSPILWFMMVYIAIITVVKQRNTSRMLFLLSFFIVPVLFFTYSSISKKVEANWAAPAYLAGTLLLLIWWEALTAEQVWARRITIIAVVISLVLTFVVYVHIICPFVPLKPNRDTTAQMRGWEEFGKRVGDVRKRIDPTGKRMLSANRYQLAAIMAFHVPGQPRTRALNLCSRLNHYSLLSLPETDQEIPLLFVNPGLPDNLSQCIQDNIDSLIAVDTIAIKKYKTEEAYTIYTGRISRETLFKKTRIE